MMISDKGIEHIKLFEGFSPEAYRDIAGVWTIGYGHTETAKPGMFITPSEGEKLLRRDVENAEHAVNNLVDVPLTQEQFDALASFTFNLGYRNFRDSTLLRKLNEGDYAGAGEEFTRWIYATDPDTGKKVAVNGLRRRREAEKAIFLSSDVSSS